MTDSTAKIKESKKPPLIFIVGPTCSGKSHWALQMAEAVSGGILNADSIQFYEGLDIGSAKPGFHKTPHIPHFLFQEARAPEVLTAGDFRKKALKILKNELPRRKIFVTGGSGFYIQALEKGMFPVKPVPKNILKELKEAQKTKGLQWLYQELCEKDPSLAESINPNDSYRILRALSVITNEKRPLSEIKKRNIVKKLNWPYKKIGLQISKEELEKRVIRRTASLLKKGLVEETESFVRRGFSNWRPLQSVGYKECLLYLKGKIKQKDLAEQIVKRTLAMAKKQKTWFQKDTSILWKDFQDDPLAVYNSL